MAKRKPAQSIQSDAVASSDASADYAAPIFEPRPRKSPAFFAVSSEVAALWLFTVLALVLAITAWTSRPRTIELRVVFPQMDVQPESTPSNQTPQDHGQKPYFEDPMLRKTKSIWGPTLAPPEYRDPSIDPFE